MLFPWVALFHTGLFLYLLVDYIMDAPMSPALWIAGPVWMLCYTISWLFICDLKRRAAFCYIGLTAISIIVQLTLNRGPHIAVYADLLFPVNILFCFFVLFYFKRFD